MTRKLNPELVVGEGSHPAGSPSVLVGRSQWRRRILRGRSCFQLTHRSGDTAHCGVSAVADP